jgi:hypothetical protein
VSSDELIILRHSEIAELPELLSRRLLPTSELSILSTFSVFFVLYDIFKKAVSE